MIKKSYILVIIVLTCLIGTYFFVYENDSLSDKNVGSLRNIYVEKALVDSQSILATSIPTVRSEDLHPEIKVILKDGASLKHLRIDGLDMLGDESLKKDVVVNGGSIIFKPSFLLEPGFHSVSVVYAVGEDYGEVEASFVLEYVEDFSSPDSLGLFVIPDNTKSNYEYSWYVKDGELQIDKLSKTSHASLAFLYPMGDTEVVFDFKPKGSNLSLAFYFIDTNRTIVFGNGDDKRITLLKEKPSIDGEPFRFTAGEQYNARIVRKGNVYDVYVRRAGDFTWSHSLHFEDNQHSVKESVIGFTLWSTSDGAQIDNVRIK